MRKCSGKWQWPHKKKSVTHVIHLGIPLHISTYRVKYLIYLNLYVCVLKLSASDSDKVSWFSSFLILERHGIYTKYVRFTFKNSISGLSSGLKLQARLNSGLLHIRPYAPPLCSDSEWQTVKQREHGTAVKTSAWRGTLLPPPNSVGQSKSRGQAQHQWVGDSTLPPLVGDNAKSMKKAIYIYTV